MFDLLMIALLQAVAGEPSAPAPTAEQTAAAPATAPTATPNQTGANVPSQPAPLMRRQRVCQEIEVTGNRIPQRVCQYVMVEEAPPQQAPQSQGE